MRKRIETLEFACCGCPQGVRVTVRCSSVPSPAGENLASVNIPCPSCGQTNQLLFEPGGRVRSVRPYTCFRVLAEPSLN